MNKEAQRLLVAGMVALGLFLLLSLALSQDPPPPSGGEYVKKSTWIITGDLVTKRSDGYVIRFGPGTEGQALMVSTSSTYGLAWSNVVTTGGALSNLTDVTLAGLVINDVLSWDGSKWVNVVAGGGSTNAISTVGTNGTAVTNGALVLMFYNGSWLTMRATNGGDGTVHLFLDAITNGLALEAWVTAGLEPYQIGSVNLSNWSQLATGLVDTKLVPYQTGSVNLTNWSGLATGILDTKLVGYQWGSVNLSNWSGLATGLVDTKIEPLQTGSINLSNWSQLATGFVDTKLTAYQWGSVNLTNWSDWPTNTVLGLINGKQAGTVNLTNWSDWPTNTVLGLINGKQAADADLDAWALWPTNTVLELIQAKQLGSANLTNWSTLTTNSFLNTNAQSAYGYIDIQARAMWAPATGGAAWTTNSSGFSNAFVEMTYDFDAAAAETNFFSFAIPMDMDCAAAVKAKIFFTSALTPNGPQAVVWGIKLGSVTNGEAGQCFGASSLSTNDCGNVANIMMIGANGPITIGGTPAIGEMCYGQLRRLGADTADTLAADAKLRALVIQYTKIRTAETAWP